MRECRYIGCFLNKIERGSQYLAKIVYMSNTKDLDVDVGLLKAKAKPKLKRPPLYQVIMLNDDYTPMDFVVEVLILFFNMNEAQALNVMLDVHQKGKGACGVYTRDIAETKVAQVIDCAAQNEHPLLCKMEKI